jgi:hypothetical protein
MDWWTIRVHRVERLKGLNFPKYRLFNPYDRWINSNLKLDQSFIMFMKKLIKKAPKECTNRYYDCNYPGCGKKHMRSDNLKTHIKNKHLKDLPMTEKSFPVDLSNENDTKKTIEGVH